MNGQHKDVLGLEKHGILASLHVHLQHNSQYVTRFAKT